MIFIQAILDWLEVWSLLIPLAVLSLRKKQPEYFKPVIAYIFLALLVNLFSNISWKFKHDYSFPVWFQTNTYFYSVHSIVRLFLLGWFFILLNQPFLKNAKKLALVIFSIFIMVNFTFEPFINFWYSNGRLQSTISYRLLAVEAAIMLFYCLQYYLYKVMQDYEEERWTPDFWVVTGLAIFSFCSFPIYFFYKAILFNYVTFTTEIWMVQKVCFLIFCGCIARAFYVSKNVYSTIATSK